MSAAPFSCRAKILTNRLRVIEYAIEADDLDTAMRLAEDGYAQTKGPYSGYAEVWLRMQLEIAQKQKNNAQVIALARKLFLETHDEPMKLYALLKCLIAQKDWHAFVEELIVSMKSLAPGNESTLGKVLVQERWLDRLIALVQKQNSPHFTAQFETALMPKYSSELVAFYEKILVKHFGFCNDRKSYAIACDYLRKMKKLGGHDAVQTMVNFIRKEFSNRPAFLDELKRV